MGEEDPRVNVYDSSDEDEQAIQNEKRKRELLWKQREEDEEKLALFSHEDLLRKAF